MGSFYGMNPFCLDLSVYLLMESRSTSFPSYLSSDGDGAWWHLDVMKW